MPPGPLLGQKGAYADVASANSTLNTLMPGRQKSWMTNTPVQPSPRRRRPPPPDAGPLQSRQSVVPSQQQSNQQTNPDHLEPDAHPPRRQSQQAPLTPSNVLPSPAPSDEPSPAALSNYKDSPNPQTVSLAAASRGPSKLAVTGTREPAPAQSSTAANPGPEAFSPGVGGAEPTSPEQTGLGAPAQAVQSPLAMPPPNLPNGNQTEPSPGGAPVVGPSPRLESRPRSAGAQEHPNKRRRVENVNTSRTFTEWAASIDTRIAQIGGEDQLTPVVEAPRLQILKDACTNRDVFYLHLHSLYCLWSCDPQSLPPILSHDLDATHRGFSIVETVLKKNSGFRQDNLMWCASFPREDFNQDDPEGVTQVANFLAGLSQHWPTLSPAIYNRHYPYLVDELLDQLQCYSLIMQNILFTASRRRLGIPDGFFGDRVQDLFRLDQKQHMDEQGSFRHLVVPDDLRDTNDQERIERCNLVLIRAYRELCSKARAGDDHSAQNAEHQQARFSQQQRERRRQELEQVRQREEEYPQTAAAAQRLAHQRAQRQQLQQTETRLQQQQMLRNQAMLGSQQNGQIQNQWQLGQLPAQTHQGHPGQQQQIHPQWVHGRLPDAAASHTRRSSLNTHQQIAQPAAQSSPRPQSSGTFPGPGSPTVPQNTLRLRNLAPQLSHLPPNLVLSSNAQISRTMPGVAQTHHQYSMPHQQQPQQPPQQLAHGQNQTVFSPWSASIPSPTVAQSPRMPTMRTVNPSASPVMGGQQTGSRPQSRATVPSQAMQPQMMQQQHMAQQQMIQQQMAQQQMFQQRILQQQMIGQHMVQQHMRPQQMRQRMGHQQQQMQLQVGQQRTQQMMQSNQRLVPPPNHVIDRSEYPHSHQEKKSLLMSLHQAHARSPDRTRRNGDAGERYYQSIDLLAVQPFRLIFYHEVPFEVSPEQFSRLCQQKTLPQPSNGAPKETHTPASIREYGDGSLRFRVRCCRLRSEKEPIQESDWVTKDMLWPEHIFVHVNEQKLVVRRGTHNGKDLPIELTDFLFPGTNRLKVVVPRAGPTAADKGGKIFFLAIEIVETSSHTALLRDIQTNHRADREETLEKIRTRVNAAPDDDDEIAVIDRTGSTACELSIGLTDPFSARIFSTPARGWKCTHLECFDLETWLTTRPIKQPIKCGHRDVCTCPKRLEPTEPDKWKCPICFEDARPSSLRVDSFLEDVRKQLDERNQLDTKSILVTADGTWRPVDEPDDDEGSDGDGPVGATRRSMSLRRSAGPNNKSASVERGRAPVEVIELD